LIDVDLHGAAFIGVPLKHIHAAPPHPIPPLTTSSQPGQGRARCRPHQPTKRLLFKFRH